MIARVVAAVSLFAAAMPALARPPSVPKADNAELTGMLATGETLEGRVDGDLDGDGQIDTAFVGRGEDKRSLYVAITYCDQFSCSHAPMGPGPLDPYPLGTAELSVTRGVLTVKDLTGGTSATQVIYRLRYEPATKKMRLIGLDTSFYSRTYAHDGREMSWNLLTGDRTTRAMTLVKGGGGYVNGPIIRSRKLSKPVYLEKLPDIEGLTTG